MSRLLFVVATMSSLLTCPWQCRMTNVPSAHARAGCGDHGHEPQPDHHHGDDDGCSCLCCSGAIVEFERLGATSLDVSYPLAADCTRLQVVAVAGVAHHRWRLLSPDSDSASGRALRARMASYLI